MALSFLAGFIYTCIGLVTAFFLWSLSWSPYRRLPPGPRPWPIIGNLLHVKKDGFGSTVHLAKKFGSLYTLWMGPKPVIIISGPENLHEALISRSDVFSKRCDMYSMKHLSCNFKTVNTSSGVLWRTLRRNLMFEVLNSTRVRSYKPVRDFEFQNLVERFKEDARDNDGVVRVLTPVRRTLFNILMTMCFGERVEESVVREMDGLLMERVRMLRPTLCDYFSILRLFDVRRVRERKSIQKRTVDLLIPYIQKARDAMLNREPVSGRNGSCKAGLTRRSLSILPNTFIFANIGLKARAWQSSGSKFNIKEEQNALVFLSLALSYQSLYDTLANLAISIYRPKKLMYLCHRRYVETLLQIQARSVEAGKEDPLTDEQIVSLCVEVLNAGTDTTAYTAERILARLVDDPDVQRKLVEEMETVLGEKTIDESSIDSLPYLQAVVKEAVRLHPAGKFALPYAVNRAGVKIAEFDIPENAIVMFYIASANQDAKIWEDPQNFRPERFLNEMAEADVSGAKKITFLPFGVGKRICPGMNLAMLELFKLIGLLVQTFEWTNDGPPNSKVDLTTVTPGGSASSLETPLSARIRDRQSRNSLQGQVS